MKKKTIILSAILLLLSSLSLYSAQAVETTGNASTTGANTVSDAEMGWPERYKMEYKLYIPFNHFFNFYIDGKKYTLNDSELENIAGLTDNATNGYFNKLKYLYINKSYTKQSYKSIDLASKTFRDSFNAFLVSDSSGTVKLKRYFQKKYLKKKAEESKKYNDREYFIGVRTLAGSELGIGLRFGLFFPAYENLKIGFLADFVYNKILLFDNDGNTPRFIGGDILFAMKVKGFYLAGGGFSHFRVSGEWVHHYRSENHTLYHIRPVDYGLCFSIGYIDIKRFKWFAGLTFRYSFETSKDEYYKQTGYEVLRQGNLSLEAGIGF
jgi:hypothetical protein